MPMYMYVDKKTDKQVEVLRNFSEYNVVPTLEESGLTPEEYTQAEWERRIGKVLVTKNPYFGSKGNW